MIKTETESSCSGHGERIHRLVVGRRGVLLGIAAGLLAAPTSVFAQSDAEANAIIRSLAPIRGQASSDGYRSGRREPVDLGANRIYVDIHRSISLEIYFDFNRARITPRARHQLAALGRALSSLELRPYRYLIAGHTDAVGSDGYNLDLSKRRANAVRDYLVSAFSVEPDRLVAVGFGERRLKRPDAPRAAINRRVEVTLIVT